MWGTQGRHRAGPVSPRFIPTNVGNTSAKPGIMSIRSVHPHACGEHDTWTKRPFESRGSSPRMWGTQTRGNGTVGVERFIPTHVGNTLSSSWILIDIAVHPHACGEHWLNYRPVTYQTGSSPRMWGTHLRRRKRDVVQRFIPTHVGNTQPSTTHPLPGSVHPHACGEHITGAAPLASPTGSSPRMWGTPDAVDRCRQYSRFIPTHVGNTGKNVVAVVDGAVHPHACGEHGKRSAIQKQRTGSSPRMWGTPRLPIL